MRGLLIAAVFAFFSVSVATAQTYRYEAENGSLAGNGTSIQNNGGASGSQYVRFNSGDAGNAVTVSPTDLPDGLYELWVGFRTPFGEKGYYFDVGGVSGSGMFDASSAFSEDLAGLFAVDGGLGAASVSQFWGYHDIDFLEFRPYQPTEVLPVPATLVNENADLRTRQLMRYLTDIYGEKTLSGLQHDVHSGTNTFPPTSYASKSGGLLPAVRGSDLMNYSPTRVQFGQSAHDEVEDTIAWAQQTGGVVTMMWHWNAPDDLINQPGMEWWRGFYTDSTTFDLAGALSNPGGADYGKIISDIDAIAVQLQKLEDANIPVIWRPLHEAEGGWFWWGAHGADNFKALWNITYDRLTNHHGLDNLIWEFTDLGDPEWYPGDDVVDMIGLDIYTDPTDNMSGPWLDALERYNGNKPIALSESGTLPDADEMEQWGIAWNYFATWNGFDSAFTAQQLQETLGDEDILTLDELPWFPWANTLPTDGDYDNDGDTDVHDLLWWQRWDGSAEGLSSIEDNAGQGSTAANVATTPEPTAAVLAVLAVAGFVHTRRRTL
ncbi:MAG: glycosyl hydrolase [Planctomycetota bacterium]